MAEKKREMIEKHEILLRNGAVFIVSGEPIVPLKRINVTIKEPVIPLKRIEFKEKRPKLPKT